MLPAHSHRWAEGPVLGDVLGCLAGGGDADDGSCADVVSGVNRADGTAIEKSVVILSVTMLSVSAS